MEKDNLHVMQDRIQSLVRGIVGELFVPDNRPRQDQQFGATEACRELELTVTETLTPRNSVNGPVVTSSTSCSLCGRLYIHALGEAGKNIFQKRF
jgi:hypothetical protein